VDTARLVGSGRGKLVGRPASTGWFRSDFAGFPQRDRRGRRFRSSIRRSKRFPADVSHQIFMWNMLRTHQRRSRVVTVAPPTHRRPQHRREYSLVGFALYTAPSVMAAFLTSPGLTQKIAP
jgi:hypothetical protein